MFLFLEMDEWDGIRLRALFQENVPGLLDVMVRMHGDQEYEASFSIQSFFGRKGNI